MKRILVSILILFFTFLLYVVFKLLPDFYLDLGKNDYLNKDYISAYKNLKTALIFSPKNRDIRYYYTQTLINMKPTLEVQKELFKISEVNQSDSADLIAEEQIAIWKNQILSNIGENYIEQVPLNGQVLRWDATKFPLRVYIKNNSSSTPQYYQDSIQQAFLQWQKSTGDFITFQFTDNEQQANIVVSINSSADMKKCDQQDCKYTVAYTTPDLEGDFLKKMEIFFYDSNNLGQPFSQKEIYNTALHEIGHSLGIMGHSYNKDNLMYMETNEDNSYFNQFRSDFQSISQVDLNTLNLLYKLVPDITNTPLREFNTSHQFYPHIVLGSDEQITSQKILEAQNYIHSAPELPNGYIDLAAGYAELKKYNKAIDALNQALQYSSNNDEKFMVYYNTAVIYISLKDWQNALEYANLAQQADPTSVDIDGLIAMVNYNLGHRAEAKQAYTEAIQKSPDNIINSYNLAIIYIRELNLPQAGKVLNNLIKANPDAKNDPRVKMFLWLTLLFK